MFFTEEIFTKALIIFSLFWLLEIGSWFLIEIAFRMKQRKIKSEITLRQARQNLTATQIELAIEKNKIRPQRSELN